MAGTESIEVLVSTELNELEEESGEKPLWFDEEANKDDSLVLEVEDELCPSVF